jgi:hypothetical protein
VGSWVATDAGWSWRFERCKLQRSTVSVRAPTKTRVFAPRSLPFELVHTVVAAAGVLVRGGILVLRARVGSSVRGCRGVERAREQRSDDRFSPATRSRHCGGPNCGSQTVVCVQAPHTIGGHTDSHSRALAIFSDSWRDQDRCSWHLGEQRLVCQHSAQQAHRSWSRRFRHVRRSW